jgi:hypothetical protein
MSAIIPHAVKCTIFATHMHLYINQVEENFDMWKIEMRKERSKGNRKERKLPLRNKMFQTVPWDLEKICFSRIYVSFEAEIASHYEWI